MTGSCLTLACRARGSSFLASQAVLPFFDRFGLSGALCGVRVSLRGVAGAFAAVHVALGSHRASPSSLVCLYHGYRLSVAAVHGVLGMAFGTLGGTAGSLHMERDFHTSTSGPSTSFAFGLDRLGGVHISLARQNYGRFLHLGGKFSAFDLQRAYMDGLCLYIQRARFGRRDQISLVLLSHGRLGDCLLCCLWNPLMGQVLRSSWQPPDVYALAGFSLCRHYASLGSRSTGTHGSPSVRL